MQENTEIVFYKEWLALPKDQFRILLHLARNGSFRGNLSDLCRYFSLDPQDKTRKALRRSIEELAEGGYIEYGKSGRTYTLKPIPKEKEIKLACGWVDEIISRKPYSVSVSAEAVIKVLLWLQDYGSEIFTNDIIAADLDLSVSTLNCAKKVLNDDFGAIVREYVTTKVDEGVYYREGQIVTISAWLNDN